jgi:hypothetical protein
MKKLMFCMILFCMYSKLQPHVFVRMAKGEDYTYLGKGLYETRYDKKCNKIYFTGSK